MTSTSKVRLKPSVDCRFFSDLSGCVFYNVLNNQTYFVHIQCRESSLKAFLEGGGAATEFEKLFIEPPETLIEELMNKGIVAVT